MKKISMMVMVTVFAAFTMQANEFTKVTSAPTDWSGQYLLTYTSGDSVCIFNGKDANNAYVRVNKPTDGKISSNDLDGYVVELATMTGGYSVKLVASGKYMSGDASANIINFDTEPALNTVMFGNADSVELISNTSKFVFNSTKKNGLRFRYFKEKTAATTKTYKRLTLYKAKNEIKPEEWTPDTITVSEARALIAKSDPLMKKSHYVVGVVADNNYGKTWPGWAMIWMTDIDNPTDSLEGYKIYKDANSTKWASAEEIPCGLNDTVMLFADGLDKFGSKYETTSGYYVKTLGESSALDANAVFPYAFGAVQMEMVGGKYRYEIVLSKEEDEYGNALHYVIRSANEKGIAGTYDTYLDSSYVDGEGQVTGSLKIAFVSEGNPNNNYSIKGDFMVGGLKYHMDTTYALAGYTDPDSEPFKLVDDVPFIPQEGDTLTCAVAAKYALTVLAENETSKINVFVLGYANNVGEISSNQQTCYMDDEASETKTLQSYYGNLSGKKITAGSQVLIYGKMMHYSKNSSHVAEMKNGIVQVLQGGTDVPDRGLTYENLPAGAITIAQAKALCDNLVGVDTTEEVTVKGYVVDIYKTWNSTSKQQSFYMGDEYVIGVKTHFEAFNANLAAGVMVGDKMFVTGRVTKYNDSYNLVQGTGHFTSSLTKLNEMVKSAPQGKVQKVFCNGAIYIIREGVAYDLQGNVMK